MRALKSAPTPLRLQVISRMCLIALTSILVIAMVLLVGDIVIITAGLGMLTSIAVSLFSLLDIVKKEAYLVIEGSCVDYSTTGLRRRVKRITISSPEGIVEVRPRETVKLRKDCMVRLYMRNSARIYLENDKRIVFDYLAIEAII